MEFKDSKINMRDFVTRASHNKNIRWVSVKDIQDSLPNHKINVGFDVDDTLLFSSMVFYFLQQKYGIANGELYPQELWDEACVDLDKMFSMPKESAKEVVKMHQDRGDEIFFITGRMPPRRENLSETLHEIFEIKNPRKAIFTGHIPHTTSFEKTPFLQKHNIELYYGDSDIDILAAHECGIRGIRFLRPTNSITFPHPDAGCFGEEVLIASDF